MSVEEKIQQGLELAAALETAGSEDAVRVRILSQRAAARLKLFDPKAATEADIREPIEQLLSLARDKQVAAACKEPVRKLQELLTPPKWEDTPEMAFGALKIRHFPVLGARKVESDGLITFVDEVETMLETVGREGWILSWKTRSGDRMFVILKDVHRDGRTMRGRCEGRSYNSKTKVRGDVSRELDFDDVREICKAAIQICNAATPQEVLEKYLTPQK